MARFKQPPYDGAVIAAQLEPFLRQPGARPEKIRPLAIAESIPMWRLEQDRLDKAKSVSDAAVPMGRWHHQIVANGAPVAHAVSREDSARLTTVEHGDALAHAIDQAIRVLDEQKDFDEDVEVRLLAVPSFHISTLWMSGVGVDEILVLPGTTPERAERRLGIEKFMPMPGGQFLEMLRKAGSIRGFASRGPQPLSR